MMLTGQDRAVDRKLNAPFHHAVRRFRFDTICPGIYVNADQGVVVFQEGFHRKVIKNTPSTNWSRSSVTG